WEKVAEELDELRELVDGDASDERKEEELGDLLFAIVNHARLSGINPENALARTNAKFIRRFQGVEKALEAEGSSLVDATLEEMDVHWERIKKEERAR
ncbi:MAG: MazG nucleotide pyrophosphohydrolase domain-containing protein, partial [Rhodothermales bacterium]